MKVLVNLLISELTLRRYLDYLTSSGYRWGRC
jgi:hypothetical protein